MVSAVWRSGVKENDEGYYLSFTKALNLMLSMEESVFSSSIEIFPTLIYSFK